MGKKDGLSGFWNSGIYQDVPQLSLMTEAIARNCSPAACRLLWEGHPFLTEKVIGKLYRSSPERQQSELGHVLAGRRPFSVRSTVPDTVSFGEVTSRLGRAAGAVNKVHQVFRKMAQTVVVPVPLRQALWERAEEALGHCTTLRALSAARYSEHPAECKKCKALRIGPNRDWSEGEYDQQYFGKIQGELERATTFLRKSVCDLPINPGIYPTWEQDHDIGVQLFKIERSLNWFVGDLHAVGNNLLGLLPAQSKHRKRIATHRKPDLDDLASIWMMDRLMFESKAEILFVSHNEDFSRSEPVDCVVGMGGMYDPYSLLFDHKLPAFEDRYQISAAILVWLELRRRGVRVNHLTGLVQAVSDGNSVRHRESSQEYAFSKEFHSALKKEKGRATSDEDLYRRMSRWLDKHCGV